MSAWFMSQAALFLTTIAILYLELFFFLHLLLIITQFVCLSVLYLDPFLSSKKGEVCFKEW